MSIINCFNCAVVNIPQKSLSRMPHKSCETGYNKSCLIFTLPMRYATFVNQSQSLKLYFQDRYQQFSVNDDFLHLSFTHKICLHISLPFRAECINFMSRFSKIICILEAML